MFQPRPNQRDVLSYRSGKMGVSAVPGSGKTHTLARLAAEIIARDVLEEDQEVLIVTLVNSAVDNFATRIASFLREMHLPPRLGYRVRTLHGLAHDIVRERPGLVGLADDFQIIDERAADQVRDEAAQAWLRANPAVLDDFLNPDLDENRRDQIRRKDLPEMVKSVALSFIRSAKDLQITPEPLKERLAALPVPLPLAQMGQAIYADYQRALVYRGAADFDDLIRLALLALRLDRYFLESLQYRWPYILEDEAQDSNRLQEEILETLAGKRGNWVRVGDPNQAIYETFTTANPRFLRDFLKRPDVYARQLPDSGRSTHSVIALANFLVNWTRAEHPEESIRDALAPTLISPSPPGDPQPNPDDNPGAIYLAMTKYSPQGEIQAVADSLERWLPDHQEETVAVLVPRNQRGYELARELERRHLDYVENLRSTSATRTTADILHKIVIHLANPGSPARLAEAYLAWRRAGGIGKEYRKFTRRAASLLRKCRQVEDFIWPRAGVDWLEEQKRAVEEEQVLDELAAFRSLSQRWHGAVLLPVDQLLLTLAQDLFREVVDLAVAQKLANILARESEAHPDSRLPDLAEELRVVAHNERRFLGFADDDLGFDPDRHKGKVVVATIHKAKGLEWDRVYMMSVNNYDFPSGSAYDSYIAERWFVRDRLNLEAEALAQLEAAFSTGEYTWYQEGLATLQARLDYVAERLRLLYVGITRAKKELIVTCNTGRQGNVVPALPLVALQAYWEQELDQRQVKGLGDAD